MSPLSPFATRSTWRRSLGPAVLAAALLLLWAASNALAADLTATPSTFSSVFSSAQAGDVVHLAAGSYGTFNGGSKSGMVTVTAQSGAAVTMSANLGSSQNITIDGITVSGANVGTSSVPGQHIHFTNDTFTGDSVVHTPTNANIDVLFDHDTFANITTSGGYEARIGISGNNNSSANDGVTIQNSTFGPGGCDDGIEVFGGASGMSIVSNEFTGIKQGSCSNHADPIQFYGAQNITVSGNYFHGNSTGIMSPDGAGSPMFVTNNVFVTDGEYPDQVTIGHGVNDVIKHNVFANGADIRLGKQNTSSLSTGETVEDNVLTGGFSLTEGQTTSGLSIDYNICSKSCPGSHSLAGSPVYTGGASPSTWAGYALSATSPGHAAASDGSDIGITSGPVTPPTTPDTTITSTPAATTSATSATFAFTGSSPSGGAVTFTCSLDGGAYATCSSPVSYTGISVGSHSFAVRSTDLLGQTDPSPATYAWTVVDSSILLGNQAIAGTDDSTAAGAAEAFSATGLNAGTAGSVKVYVDSGSAASKLQVGLYADASGHPGALLASGSDSTPAAGAWNTVALSTSPTIAAGTTYWIAVLGTGGALNFRDDGGSCVSWSSSSSSLASLPTTWSSGSSWSSCSLSAYVVAGSAPVDTTPPDTSITSAPSGSTTSTSASVAFSSSESGSTFECRLDGGAWSACTSPKVYSGLGVGSHTVDVRATDQAGNTDRSPASASWTVSAPVDTTPPDTSITSAPSGSTTSTSASVAFSSSESGSTFECRLDGGAWSACTSPKVYSGLGVGSHTVDVRATDQAGNTDRSPASASWTVSAQDPAPDPSPAGTTTSAAALTTVAAPATPQTAITAAPPNPTASRTASFRFAADVGGSTFQCKLDTRAWATCASPTSYARLTYGGHSFQVRAVDPAGDADPTPAADTWTVSRHVKGATAAVYTFEVLSPSPDGVPSTVQASDAADACASTGHGAHRVAVDLHGVRRRHAAHRRVRLTGRVPAFAAQHGLAQLRVSVHRHRGWHLVASRRVRVASGSFALTVHMPAGRARVSAVVRCA